MFGFGNVSIRQYILYCIYLRQYVLNSNNCIDYSYCIIFILYTFDKTGNINRSNYILYYNHSLYLLFSLCNTIYSNFRNFSLFLILYPNKVSMFIWYLGNPYFQFLKNKYYRLFLSRHLKYK